MLAPWFYIDWRTKQGKGSIDDALTGRLLVREPYSHVKGWWGDRKGGSYNP